MTEKSILVVDISPLWEIHYTGIANVVYELTKRFLTEKTSQFEIVFSVFWKQVDTHIIEKCIDERCGQYLQESFNENRGVKEIDTDMHGNINGRKTFGLFLHRKQNRKVFSKDAYLFYDFSFLLTTECHTKETVVFHSENLAEQVSSTELFFCISESTAKDLRWIFNVPKDKVVVSLLGNNVDTSIADKARALIGNRKIEPYFLILGTIEPRKNIGIILAWLSENKKILEKYRFVFAGRQGWGKSFDDYIVEYELSDEFNIGRIVHYGYVDEAQKATLLVGAKAVFYPSLFEGFGLPVLEAMELGVPVIASCSTSIPEVLGDTGYYFDPYSLSSFEKAFAEFIKDDLTGKLDVICVAAKIRAGTFSYDKTYRTIYQALIKHFVEDFNHLENISEEDMLTVICELPVKSDVSIGVNDCKQEDNNFKRIDVVNEISSFKSKKNSNVKTKQRNKKR